MEKKKKSASKKVAVPSKKKKVNLKELKPKISTQPNTIPLTEAQKMICNWQNSVAYEQTGKFKAFHIPQDEITEFFKKYKDENIGVRAYIGLSSSGSDATDANLKLIFVATKRETDFSHKVISSFDKDIIDTELGEKVVYDLSSPCPHYCDSSSPLYDPSCGQ